MNERLTPLMRDVLGKLADGWELGHALTRNLSFTWLQDGGLGKGGEMRQISTRTFHALFNRGYIYQLDTSWHVEGYWLTEEGEDAVRVEEK